MSIFSKKPVLTLACLVAFLLLATTALASPILKWKLPKEEREPVSRPETTRLSPQYRPGKVWKDPYLGMEFVWVPGGCYQMGQSDKEKQWLIRQVGRKNYVKYLSDERPVHRVCVDGFWIGKYEVTFDQYDRFCEETGREKPSDKGWGRGNRPVINVTWYDAKAFANWLSKKTGYKFRLPTEAEWEYACRSGGKDQMFAGFSDVNELYRYANFCDRNCLWPWKTREQDDGYSYTAPVGSFAPNGLGLYDMSGNVWEWCEDWYDKDYYSKSPRNNPRGPSSGKYRVLRGGSWDDFSWSVRCAYRDRGEPVNSSYGGGFRLVRVPGR